MILAYIVLIPLLTFSLWAFFKSSPKRINSNKIKIYNLGTITVSMFLCLSYVFKLRASMINGSDFGWWPVLAFIFSLVIIIGTIFLSGILRNFVFFKNKSR